jgi:hypothetical protein
MAGPKRFHYTGSRLQTVMLERWNLCRRYFWTASTPQSIARMIEVATLYQKCKVAITNANPKSRRDVQAEDRNGGFSRSRIIGMSGKMKPNWMMAAA